MATPGRYGGGPPPLLRTPVAIPYGLSPPRSVPYSQGSYNMGYNISGITAGMGGMNVGAGYQTYGALNQCHHRAVFDSPSPPVRNSRLSAESPVFVPSSPAFNTMRRKLPPIGPKNDPHGTAPNFPRIDKIRNMTFMSPPPSPYSPAAEKIKALLGNANSPVYSNFQVSFPIFDLQHPVKRTLFTNTCCIKK